MKKEEESAGRQRIRAIVYVQMLSSDSTAISIQTCPIVLLLPVPSDAITTTRGRGKLQKLAEIGMPFVIAGPLQ